jgi:hypothetical protein
MGSAPAGKRRKEKVLMKKSLLLLGVIAALAVGAPAHSQYIYLDVNPGGDGLNSSADALTSSSTSVDVYLNTNHNRAGTTDICNDGTNPLDIGSYDILLESSGSGSVTYGSWTNNMAGYAVLNPPTVVGPDFGVGYGSALAFTAPGLYKLGTLGLTVTGTPVLKFLTNQPVGIPSPVTGFGSECSGTDFANTITLGTNFFDADGTASPTPVMSTTWGKIKQLYK